MTTRPPRPRAVVVGGGIGGLTAAYLLGDTHDVLLLEGSPDVGGKLRLGEVAGLTVDVGAEAMLNRRPEGVALAGGLGLDLVHPASTATAVWSRGELRPMPRTLMGVPLDVEALEASGLISEAGLAAVRAEPGLDPAPLDGDVSVGDLVAARLGDEVVDLLVEPLLGGVYAGHARLLSVRATVPQLAALAERGSLVEGAAAFPTSDVPVFASLEGGMGRLPGVLAASGRFAVRTGAMVRGLRRAGDGFELVVGPTRDEEVVAADVVVLATPATPTSRLLADLAPRAAAELAGLEHASSAVVTFAVRAADAPGLAATPLSGFLVPPVEGRRIKASTFSFSKWAWVRELGRSGGDGAEGVLVFRTSLGRHREEASLQASDDELVAWSLADLRDAIGLDATPLDTHVQRWGGGLPQYAVGHLDLVARVRDDVAAVPGLALCGAAYDGVGIPAVIGSARRAVEQLRQVPSSSA